MFHEGPTSLTDIGFHVPVLLYEAPRAKLHACNELVLCSDTDNEESRAVYRTNFEAIVRR